jgi:hypothetical protein
MTTYTEVCEFIEKSSEITETIEDDFSVFKHTHDSTETCQLIRSETFDWMPDQIIETFIIETYALEVGFQGGLILDSF